MGLATILLMVSVFQVNQIPLGLSPFQESAMVRGRVMDPDPHFPRGGLGNVTIFLESPTDVESATSDSKGYFYFLSLLPGTYWAAVRPQYQCLISSRVDSYEFAAGYEYLATIRLPEGCI